MLLDELGGDAPCGELGVVPCDARGELGGDDHCDASMGCEDATKGTKRRVPRGGGPVKVGRLVQLTLMQSLMRAGKAAARYLRTYTLLYHVFLQPMGGLQGATTDTYGELAKHNNEYPWERCQAQQRATISCDELWAVSCETCDGVCGDAFCDALRWGVHGEARGGELGEKLGGGLAENYGVAPCDALSGDVPCDGLGGDVSCDRLWVVPYDLCAEICGGAQCGALCGEVCEALGGGLGDGIASGERQIRDATKG